MTGETLSNAHKYAEELTVEANELEPFLAFQPEDGVRLQIRNLIEGGDVGVPIYARFRDANNDPLPINSTLTWMGRKPGDEQWTVIGKTRDNIQPWVTLSLAEQQNSDNAGATVLALNGGQGAVHGVSDVEEIALAVESSAALDWANTQVYLDNKASRTFQV